MNLLASLFAPFLALVLAFPASAQDLERIKADLRKKFPEAQIETARKSGYGGLIEVTGGGEVFYTDEKTSFLLAGLPHRHEDEENVTELRVRKLSAIKFDSLPLESAIKIVRGNGSRRIAIFEDPNCGYCKRFERDLASVPTTSRCTCSCIRSSRRIRRRSRRPCGARRTAAKAWQDLMLKDAIPAGAAKCDTPIDKLVAFGRKSASAARRRSSSRTASAFPARCPSRRSRSASRTRGRRQAVADAPESPRARRGGGRYGLRHGLDRRRAACSPSGAAPTCARPGASCPPGFRPRRRIPRRSPPGRRR